MSDHSNTADNNASFLKRFYIYQKERFPFLAHGLLIAAFTFSAVSYSRITRGAEGFIEWKTFVPGVIVTLTLFFLLRVFDEFKDKEDDAKYRTYLPVPRGLISLKELKTVGIIVVLLQLTVILVFHPSMLGLFAIAIGYLCFMGVEFFVPEWLKKRQVLYIVSHMVIIPLVDIYASGLDWVLLGVDAPTGLLFFFAVSYMNGIVLEFGRKLRAPHKEEEGVVSYTGLYGIVGGTVRWLIILFITLCLAIAASVYAGYGILAFSILGGFFVICALPAILFIQKKTEKLSKLVEHASGIWTLAMYLTLGGVPMLSELIAG
jgi:hypothetical protein